MDKQAKTMPKSDEITSILLARHAELVARACAVGPVLDLASGRCGNGLHLAGLGCRVVCADVSEDALAEARDKAAGLDVETWRVDLEKEGENPLDPGVWGAIVICRYLHRPLVEPVRAAVRPGGLVLWETYTTDQPRFGKPRNPAFLLEPGELAGWFADWEIIDHFEGELDGPPRAMAGILARRPV
jgi:SAM-dependent methyltransferase